MAEIVVGLERAERARIAELLEAGRFFWVDVALSATSPDDLAEVLGIPEHTLQTLLGFGADHPASHKFRADGKHVAFALTAYLESEDVAIESPEHFRSVEVHVLVAGAYLLTVHDEPVSLPGALAPYTPEERSEQYVIYAVLEAIVASAFDALNALELELDDLAAMSADLRAGRVRMASLRSISSRLSRMRRRIAPQRGLFERIGVEIARVEGLDADDEHYFDRIGAQVNRLVDAIDAAADALATLIDLRLNETSYWLTVVATIFLPLTFITGFFGMNFKWLVGEIDSELAFWVLGIGSLVAGVAFISALVVRGSPVEPERRTR